MLVSAAVCPHPPLLVPELAAGAAGELDGLRGACHEAVAVLLGSQPDLVVVVGDAPSTGPYPDGAWGSLAPYGVDVRVGEGTGSPTLPLALTIGRWLLDREEHAEVAASFFGVGADTDAHRAAQLGETLAARADRVALLVMGDASARRSLKGPGYLDERAAPYDETVAEALGTADLQGLLALDPVLSHELLVAGRASWQVLAGAARGARWSARLVFEGAPYGVTYLVAAWTPVAEQAEG